jgi:hypothetical protein
LTGFEQWSLARQPPGRWLGSLIEQIRAVPAAEIAPVEVVREPVQAGRRSVKREERSIESRQRCPERSSVASPAVAFRVIVALELDESRRRVPTVR